MYEKITCIGFNSQNARNRKRKKRVASSLILADPGVLRSCQHRRTEFLSAGNVSVLLEPDAEGNVQAALGVGAVYGCQGNRVRRASRRGHDRPTDRQSRRN